MQSRIVSSDVNLSVQRNKTRNVISLQLQVVPWFTVTPCPAWHLRATAQPEQISAGGGTPSTRSDRTEAHRTISHGCPRRSCDLNLSGRATHCESITARHTLTPAVPPRCKVPIALNTGCPSSREL